mmetsp:Transcript_36866/g.85189  ORF Transcript_36866/g.85189 Transcript_36866/m.85189 type:complete len:141 (+) Transcript_36866:1640-2062(+)
MSRYHRCVTYTLSTCILGVITPTKKMPTFMQYHTQKFRMGKGAKGLPEVVKDLKHAGRTIDIFKIDCEGCEFETFPSWFGAGVNIRMILIEVHMANHDRIRRFFGFLQSKGYVVYHKEPNTLGCGGTCQEFGLLKLDPDF